MRLLMLFISQSMMQSVQQFFSYEIFVFVGSVFANDREGAEVFFCEQLEWGGEIIFFRERTEFGEAFFDDLLQAIMETE